MVFKYAFGLEAITRKSLYSVQVGENAVQELLRVFSPSYRRKSLKSVFLATSVPGSIFSYLLSYSTWFFTNFLNSALFNLQGFVRTGKCPVIFI